MSQDRRTKTSDLGDALGRWLRRYRKGQLPNAIISAGGGSLGVRYLFD